MPAGPRSLSWIPSPDERTAARARFHAYPPERFERYEDYFFFLHIDPRNRAVHVVGMLLGLPFFGWALLLALRLDLWSLAVFALGHGFFYGFGVVGHVVYDGTGEARTSREHFWRAFPWILRINVETLLGTYRARLRAFVQRYPFVLEAYDLGAYSLEVTGLEEGRLEENVVPFTASPVAHPGHPAVIAASCPASRAPSPSSPASRGA